MKMHKPSGNGDSMKPKRTPPPQPVLLRAPFDEEQIGQVREAALLLEKSVQIGHAVLVNIQNPPGYKPLVGLTGAPMATGPAPFSQFLVLRLPPGVPLWVIPVPRVKIDKS